MDNIDRILFKRQSMFLFNIITNLCPTSLAGKLMSRGYFNERTPGVLTFFNVSSKKIGGACPLNSAANFTKRWPSDWFLLTKESFKSKLHELSLHFIAD